MGIGRVGDHMPTGPELDEESYFSQRLTPRDDVCRILWRNHWKTEVRTLRETMGIWLAFTPEDSGTRSDPKGAMQIDESEMVQGPRYTYE